MRWACSTTGRQELRDLAERPIPSNRDLGAHMQFDARQSNATVLMKFKQLPGLWHQLARSQASYEQKLKVLRTVAWPRCMYSVATVHLAPAHFTDARAGATNAIGCTKVGANPQIHLSLTTTAITDPESYALRHTVLQYRRQLHPDLSDVTLAPAAATPPRRRKPGPGGVLLTRLEQVCWTYQQHGIFLDGEDGVIHIFDTPIQELRARLLRSWQHMVGRQWEHRLGFQGLRYVCAPLSILATHMQPDECGLIRVAQNGTFYTNATLIHTGKVSDAQCKFCHCEDPVIHRHWECEQTRASRDMIPPMVMEFLKQASQCLLQHAWATELKKCGNLNPALP